jgi:chromate reductase
MTEARSLVFCAPEYNGSMPPIVNNAIAWVSRSGSEDWRAAFNGKPAVVATHSGGGGLKVTQAMRAQLEHLGAIVLPRPIITNYQKVFNQDSAVAILTQLKKLS